MPFDTAYWNFGNPRLPTTTRSIARAYDNPAARVAAYSPRMPDRGAFVPVNGVRTMLPDGSLGGTTRKPDNLLAGFDAVAPIKANVGAGQVLVTAMKGLVNDQRMAEKLQVRILPGNYGAFEAKAGPLRYDARSSVKRILDRRVLFGTNNREPRDQWASFLTAPRETVKKLNANATLGKSRPAPYPARVGAGDPEFRKPAPSLAVVRAVSSGQTVNLGPQNDQGNAAVKPGPTDAMLATGIDSSSLPVGSGGLERVLYLGAAVFVAWLVLR